MKIRFEIIFLATVLAVSLAFSFWLFNYRFQGYYSYHGDDEARSLIAYSVYRGDNFPAGSLILNIKPRGPVPHWLWLPFQFWFNAALLGIIQSPRLVSFVSNSLFSTGSALMIYLMAKLISGNRKTAAVGAAIWYLSLPLFRGLNISGLDLPILHFFVLAGAYCWLKADFSTRGVSSLWPAALCFLAASMVRYEGWFFVGAFEVAVIFSIIFRKPRTPRLPAALILILPLIFIALWLIDQYLRYGYLLFLSFYRRESLEGFQQLFGREPWYYKALIYPRLAVQSSPLVVISAPLAFLSWPRTGRLLLRYAGFVAVGLAILSAAAVYGGVPYAPERIAYIILLLLLPLSGAGAWEIAGLITGLVRNNKKPVAALCWILIFGGISAYNLAATTASLHNSMTTDVAQIGHLLERAIERGVIPGKEKIAYEERVMEDGEGGRWGRWDSLRLTLFAPDRLICDRYQETIVKNGLEYTDPSNLATSFFRRFSGNSLRDYLSANNITMAIIWSEESKSRMQEIFIPCGSTPRYTIFISPDKSRAVKYFNSDI